MRRRLAALLLLAALGLGSGLVACGPSPEQRRAAAERERQQRQARLDLERCRRNQPAVRRLSSAIALQTDELRRLSVTRYEPSPRPPRPDPALAARFTQADQELDELRYRERLQAWEATEQLRYSRWLAEQAGRRERLRSQLERDANELRRIAPHLMAAPAGSELKPEALARASQCRPADFGLQDRAAPARASRATAN